MERVESVRLQRGESGRGGIDEREGRGFRVLAEAMERREVSARARRQTVAMAVDPPLLSWWRTAGFRGAQESAEAALYKLLHFKSLPNSRI